MSETPRLDAIEARLAKVEETLVDAELLDPVDVPDDDGVTPRARWIALCKTVAERDGISVDEANERLLAMPEFGGPADVA